MTDAPSTCLVCGAPYVDACSRDGTQFQLPAEFHEGRVVCADVHSYPHDPYNGVSFYAHPKTLYVVEVEWETDDGGRLHDDRPDVYLSETAATSYATELSEQYDGFLTASVVEKPLEACQSG